MSKYERSREVALVKPYRAPRLTIYGDMAKLTAGGAGSPTEAIAGNNGQKHRP